MDRWVGKIAVVTGASEGCGYAIATLLVKNGMTVVGIARNIEKIEQLQKSLENATGKLYPLKTDVTKDEEVRKAFDWIKNKFGTVHVLINNAGIASMGRVVDGDPEKWRKIFDLNVIGMCVCIKAAFELMKESGVDDGHIINVNSLLGHYVPNYAQPVLNVYPASKFAVTALTETLRQELRYLKTKIRITSLSPGFIKTEFAAKAADEGFLSDNMRDFYKNRPGLLAEDVADAVKYILSTPPHVQIHELIFTADL